MQYNVLTWPKVVVNDSLLFMFYLKKDLMWKVSLFEALHISK